MGKFPYFTEVHDEIREIARGAAEEFKKTAEEADRNHDYKIVEKNLKRLAELNLLGIHVPTEYGGEGLDLVGHMIALEEISKGCLGTAFSFNTQRLAMDAIRLGGTEEQKKKYLTAACEGSIISFATTEPEAGSDVASMKTTAVKEDGGWVLNGSKHYITNAIIADTHVLFARSNSLDNPKPVFTGFIVSNDNPGIKMSKVENKMGATASPTTEYFIEDCHVSDAAVLGTVDEGMPLALSALEIARIGIGTQGLGLMQVALDQAVAYAKERVQFGKAIAKNQAIQFHIADMASRVEGAMNLLYHAAWLKDNNLPAAKEAAIAKLFATEQCTWVCNMAMNILCGPGYTTDYPVERYFRDAKVLEMGGGTSEIMRIIIARQQIGKF
ncbi:MAG: acyl-CoA dehydrogenase family protein [Dehalococcoidia bacterium]|nr:acyl-CoA dehydrogenase family protein [Dehalococcoidia bacterium]